MKVTLAKEQDLDKNELFNENYYFDVTSSTGLRWSTDMPRGRGAHEAGDEAGVFRKDLNSVVLSTTRTVDGVRTVYSWSVPRIIYENYYNVKLCDNQVIGYKDGDHSNVHPDNLHITQRSTVSPKSGKRKMSRFGTHQVRRRVDLSFRNKNNAEEFATNLEALIKHYADLESNSVQD